MADIEEIRRKIEKIYQAIDEPKEDLPPKLRVMWWASFAKDYISAASILHKEAPQYWLPILQMTGHAVECALKACLVAANKNPPKHHDLIKLYGLVAEFGFQLSDSDKAAIVHLWNFYFEDLATHTQYKARYPAEQIERLGGTVPRHSSFVSIVDSLIEQITHKGANETGDEG